ATVSISFIPSASRSVRLELDPWVRNTVAAAAADRYSSATPEDRGMRIEPPDFCEVAMDGGDVATEGVDRRRGLPDAVVPGRAANGSADRGRRRVVLPQIPLDEGELQPRRGVPGLDRLRGQRFGLRAG